MSPFIISGQDIASKIKVKKTKKYLLPENAKEMAFEYSFPTEEMIGQDVYIKKGACLSTDLDGNIYVVDSLRSVILKFDQKGRFLKKIGVRGQGPGDLFDPRYLHVDKNGDLIVYESGNRRFQILNSDGQYMKSFRVFRHYKSCSFYNGKMFVTGIEYKKDAKLVDILDMEGSLVDSFGEQIRFKNVTDEMLGSTNFKLISTNQKGEIFIAWEYFPVIHKYSESGNLLNKFEVNYERLIDWGKMNYETIKNPGKNPHFILVNRAIKAKTNGFYILSPTSRIEILECSDEGEIKNIYWANNPEDKFICKDFLIREDQNNLWIYILQFYPENNIYIYTINKKEKKIKGG